MGTPTSVAPFSPVGRPVSVLSFAAGKGGGQGRGMGHGCSHPALRLRRPVLALPTCAKGGESQNKGEEGPAATTPRRDQDGPLCSQSAVQGLGSLSFFQIGGCQLPWLLSGKGSRSISTAREQPSPGSLGTERSPQGGKGPPQALFRVPALRCCAGGGQRAAQTPLQRARLEAPPAAGAPTSPLPPSLHNKRGRPYGRPLPTHWASILRWCPPGGRRVPWSPRRWRR